MIASEASFVRVVTRKILKSEWGVRHDGPELLEHREDAVTALKHLTSRIPNMSFQISSGIVMIITLGIMFIRGSSRITDSHYGFTFGLWT